MFIVLIRVFHTYILFASQVYPHCLWSSKASEKTFLYPCRSTRTYLLPNFLFSNLHGSEWCEILLVSFARILLLVASSALLFLTLLPPSLNSAHLSLHDGIEIKVDTCRSRDCPWQKATNNSLRQTYTCRHPAILLQIVKSKWDKVSIDGNSLIFGAIKVTESSRWVCDKSSFRFRFPSVSNWCTKNLPIKSLCNLASCVNESSSHDKNTICYTSKYKVNISKGSSKR